VRNRAPEFSPGGLPRNDNGWESATSPPPLPPPFAGAGADQPREGPREMALLGEAAIQRYFGERQRRPQHQVLRALEPQLDQPAMRREAGGLLEGAAELAERQMAAARDLGETHATDDPCPQHVLGATLLPRREAAASWADGHPHGAIGSDLSRVASRNHGAELPSCTDPSPGQQHGRSRAFAPRIRSS
jgi:hypothetical protein